MIKIDDAKNARNMAIDWIANPHGERPRSAGSMIIKLTLAVCALDDKNNDEVDVPVAYRYPYKFRDIGETGAYEYHSHDFAVVANMPVGEPLYTRPQN